MRVQLRGMRLVDVHHHQRRGCGAKTNPMQDESNVCGQVRPGCTPVGQGGEDDDDGGHVLCEFVSLSLARLSATESGREESELEPAAAVQPRNPLPATVPQPRSASTRGGPVRLLDDRRLRWRMGSRTCALTRAEWTPPEA